MQKTRPDMGNKFLIGTDIGGTKCAVSLGRCNEEDVEIKEKICFDTLAVKETIEKLKSSIKSII